MQSGMSYVETNRIDLGLYRPAFCIEANIIPGGHFPGEYPGPPIPERASIDPVDGILTTTGHRGELKFRIPNDP
jgi:hypothetical protein